MRIFIFGHLHNIFKNITHLWNHRLQNILTNNLFTHVQRNGFIYMFGRAGSFQNKTRQTRDVFKQLQMSTAEIVFLPGSKKRENL